MRTLWKYYYSTIEGIIFVIDSSNKDRIFEARDEIHNLLTNEEAKLVPCLIFANKQDLPEAVKGQEITEMLGLLDHVNKKPSPMIKIQESSAV